MDQLVAYLLENLILDFQGDLTLDIVRDFLRNDDSREAKALLAKLVEDRGVSEMKRLLAAKVEKQILRRQVELLQDELRTTTQRVNLFEKVKIPESRENIRAIRVSLGDEMTAAVVRGKIAKNKLAVSQSLP